ncbi:MAG: hypothetical protein IT463_08655 [Planctomycetes bacterium]|nr:hypothetical protein [Planctomycetota bacterium]
MRSSNQQPDLRALPVLLALLLLAAWAVPLRAQEKFDRLKQEVARLATDLEAAGSAEADAAARVEENRRAQNDAAGDAKRLEELKREGRKLADSAHGAKERREQAQAALAGKQGELRDTASKHAVDRLAAQGNLQQRVNDANAGVDAWQGALGTLPSVPALRPLEGITDPALRKATQDGDRKRLKDFDAWCAAEEARLKTELSRVDQVINAEAQVKGADDGPLLIDTAKTLKKTLESRQSTLKALRADAAQKLQQLG